MSDARTSTYFGSTVVFGDDTTDAKVPLGESFSLKLGDNGGVTKFSILDSDGVEVASINSDGNANLTNGGSLVISSPTDPTDAISTTGATGVYTEVDVTNVTSSIDPTITNIGYKRCYDNGHAGAGKQVLVGLFGGFGQNGRTQFPDSMAQRMAGYVDPTSGRSPCVVKLQQRGRSNGGTIDYARDNQDVLDIIDHAAAAVGSNIFGYTTNTDGTFKTGVVPMICIGYSTGGLDALSFASRFPDRCLGVVVYFSNHDIGYDPTDSYYAKQGASIRSTIAAQVQPGGDVRLTPGAASLDEYMTRNVLDAITRIVAMQNGPHIWIMGDLDETEGITSATRLRDTLQSIPAANGKVHVHITQTGDSNRVLHSDGANGAPEQYAERYFFPYLLRNAAEWTVPEKSPAGDVRLLGWMKTKRFEIWTGATSNPKSAAGAGGRVHAGELTWDDQSRRFTFLPQTSTNGYIQIIRDGVKRSTAFTAGSKVTVDLNVSPTITAVTDIGMQYSWRADQGVTNSSGVTSWVENLGGVLAFAAAANKPAYATDGNGKNYIQFTAASSQKLVLNSLLISPLSDFSIAVTGFRSSATSGMSLFECAHHGTSARFGMQYNGTAGGYLLNDTNNWMIQQTAGVGGSPFALNTIYVFYLIRRSGVVYMSSSSIVGAVISSPFVNTSFTTTGTNTTSLGAGWADGGGAYWQFLDGGIYEVDAKQEAMSEADVISHLALMKSRWSF